MPDFDLTAQGFRLPRFHKLSQKRVLLLYLIDASKTHPVFFVRNRRRPNFRTERRMSAMSVVFCFPVKVGGTRIKHHFFFIFYDLGLTSGQSLL